jgi:hypothetical protein
MFSSMKHYNSSETNSVLMRLFQTGHPCRSRILWAIRDLCKNHQLPGGRSVLSAKGRNGQGKLSFFSYQQHFLWNILKNCSWTQDHINLLCDSDVDDTFVVWLHGMEKLQTFISHINGLRSLKFTTETESGNLLLSLIFLFMERE